MERQTPGVRAIFDQAREIDSPDERAAFLDRACAHTPDVRAEVEALLRAGAAAGSFLETPAVGGLAGGPHGGSSADDTPTGPAALADEPLEFLEPSDKPGSIGRLGHYEAREVVGRGGMGVVLKAFDETLHRVVAIKVMAPQLAASATARRRFAREARAAAAVAHDHIVTIHAVDDAGPLPYIVMQFVAGQSLQDRLDRTGPLQLHEVLRIGMQTASGLAAAHAQGLVHRDIKPANILLENGVERVKITDFGLARAADDANLTQSGTVAGTPAFMSPEQAEGKPVDHRSDLFSLGSVLYALCTGRPPFRANTSMAVLKRVCEDVPTPIREANSEVPDWLVEIVTKLQAKEPAARFQSAAEVAEALGRHLARVQHPSVAQVPGFEKPAERPPAPDRLPRVGRRWAVAAAVLVAMLAILGTTEATGVTKVRATVVRFFTPDGTLVVETDDPAVKVTVEGDGDLVITGAGPQEVRLKAGSYRLKATKDGKPVKLDRDLVTISRGDTQTVKVRLEAPVPAAISPAKIENGAFVVLGDNNTERSFGTLAEAVAAAEHGDVIEVRGDGPFETDGVEVRGRALTIRAAPGYQPVLSLSAHGREKNRTMFVGYLAPLVLEGLTFQRIGSSPVQSGALIYTETSPLRVANCRFVVKGNNAGALWGHLSPTMDVRNCEVVGSRGAVTFGRTPKEGTLSVDNCLFAANTGFGFDYSEQVQRVDIHLTRNTFAGADAAAFHIVDVPDFAASGSRPEARRYRVESENNIFAITECVYCAVPSAEAWRDKPIAVGPLKTLVADLVGWREGRNLYPPTAAFMACQRPRPTGWGPFEPLVGTDRLEEWRKFAGAEAGAQRGKPVFAGGDPWAQVVAGSPERLLPKHFRLLPQSPGYCAGKDGKDLGADVDLVGPGPAYERWKKTPEYQQWLKETGQK
jgi:hypothetical protein